MQDVVKQIPKNQHYIPCAYLARFSQKPMVEDRRKSKILRTDRKIENRYVTCETQCVREYFYSKAEAVRVEDELKELEDDYQRIIEVSENGLLSKRDSKLMINHHAIFLGRSLGTNSIKEQDGYDSFNQATCRFLGDYFYNKKIDDLRDEEFARYLFENYESFMVTTNGESLITSDVPTVAFQDSDSNAIVLSLLPVSARKLSVVYKKNSIQVKPRRLNSADVAELNTMQALNSMEAIFSYDEFDTKSVEYARKSFSKSRFSGITIFEDRHEYLFPKVDVLEGKLRFLKKTAL